MGETRYPLPQYGKARYLITPVWWVLTFDAELRLSTNNPARAPMWPRAR